MDIYAVYTRLSDEILPIVKKENPNILVSYQNSCIKNINKIKSFANNILIDSGAFTFINNHNKKNNNIDFDKYLNNYIKFIKEHDDDKIKGFFELDIDKFVTYDKVLDYRKKLFKASNKIIPVWHKRLGLEEFKKMCNDYDYISIGGIVSNEINKNELLPYVQLAHKYGTKIHGLGLTNNKSLKKIPFDSVDSSTWIGTRYGNIFKFDTKNGKQYRKRLNSKYCSDNYQRVIDLSFINYIKMQHYYKKYWKNIKY